MFLLLLLLHRLTLIIPVHPFPPPPKKLAKLPFCFIKMFVKSAQNQLLSSEICPENFYAIGFF